MTVTLISRGAAQVALEGLNKAMLDLWSVCPPKGDHEKVKHEYWNRTKDPSWEKAPPSGCDQAIERIKDVIQVWEDEVKAQEEEAE